MKLHLMAVFLAVVIVVSAFFMTTVTSNAINDSNNVIIIPVKAYVVDSGSYSSHRTEGNVRELFTKANSVWRESGIFFDLTSVNTAELNDLIIREIIRGNGAYIQQTPSYDRNSINAYFSSFTGGEANGLSLPIDSIIMISDTTTLNDFRTLSHEFGHTLGLNHASHPEQLMHSGTNGIHLTKEEISIARATALKIF